MQYVRLDPNSTGLLQYVAKLLADSTNTKLNRIQRSDDYTKTLSYYGSTNNVITITHTGTTALGEETLTETLTYEDETVEGSRVLSIAYS